LPRRGSRVRIPCSAPNPCAPPRHPFARYFWD